MSKRQVAVCGAVFLWLAIGRQDECGARTWRVPQDAPTIQAGIDAASPGDDVLVAPATYMEHDIDLGKAIWIHSRDGADATVIDGQELDRVFDVRDVSGACMIEGFTIRNGRFETGSDGGAGIACRGSNTHLTVRDCTISTCWAYAAAGGVFVLDSSVTVDGCRITQNEAGAGGGIIANSSSETPTATLVVTNSQVVDNLASEGVAGGIVAGYANVTLTNSLFARNRETYQSGAALYVVGGDATITGCTFVRNQSLFGEGSTIRLLELAMVRVDRCIIALNDGVSIECAYPGGVTVVCSDVFGNTGGDGLCGGEDLGGVFSLDPLFCDLDSDDYTLDDQSPCLPGQHPNGADCGLIGALGQGCGGSTPIEKSSWGRIKALYQGD